ncbi:PREDICTED: circadian clock-controlled protein-like [Rhagoletis zephyria]|uniref:circadian clock-controlled protein-like n=2 Tax=Rhagoletis zephyria TaxID=28612 RepID=UPI0008113124|nr:PREDICTED: circadian clock-controlled protein-like [Rhagoletis zephyria]
MQVKEILRCTYILALFLCSVAAQEESSTAATESSSTTTDAATATNAAKGLSTATSTITTTTSSAPVTSDPASKRTTSVEVASAKSTSAAEDPSQSKKYFTADDLPVCKQSSPEFNNCVKNLLEESIRRVKNGNKALNIPVIDPFRLNRTTFQYTNGNVRGRIAMLNGLTYGFSKTEIKTLDLKVIDGKIKMKLLSHVPEIRVVGNYKAELLLNNVQLRPRGEFNVSLVDVDIDQLYEGGFYEADGHRFVRMTKFDAEPKVKDFKLSASGLFPDPTLNELALNIVNQYWRQIFQVFLPETRQYWGPMLLRQINQIMSVVPYDVFVVD